MQLKDGIIIGELKVCLNDVNNITATYTKASKMISNIVSENCIISENNLILK